jgi:branched-subunit amino acid aminotransferase/4-amino-4-deoxychorismate lyase
VYGVTIVWSDGRIEERGQRDPSVVTGWGAFTTVGCDHGRPLLWSSHSRRLLSSLAYLGVSGNPGLPAEHDLCDLLAATGLDGPARLRVVARRTAPSQWAVAASATPCDAVGPEDPPAKLKIERWPAAPPLAGHKTLSRMAWDVARERAQRDGFDDVLLIDANDRLLESSVANIWIFAGDVARTPPAPERCLPGVMRGWLLENLDRAGFEVTAEDLSVRDLGDADEIWLSNAVIGVRRVGRVDDRRWPDGPRVQRLGALGVPAPGW